MIQSKIQKGFLNDVDYQNTKIKDFVYNVYSANRHYHAASIIESDDLKKYHDELFELIPDLKEVIEHYNEKARLSHKKLLLSLDKAKEIVKNETLSWD